MKKRQGLLALQDIQFHQLFIKKVGIGSLEDKSLMQKGTFLSKRRISPQMHLVSQRESDIISLLYAST